MPKKDGSPIQRLSLYRSTGVQQCAPANDTGIIHSVNWHYSNYSTQYHTGNSRLCQTSPQALRMAATCTIIVEGQTTTLAILVGYIVPDFDVAPTAGGVSTPSSPTIL